MTIADGFCTAKLARLDDGTAPATEGQSPVMDRHYLFLFINKIDDKQLIRIIGNTLPVLSCCDSNKS
jgi:hypothetical protein